MLEVDVTISIGLYQCQILQLLENGEERYEIVIRQKETFTTRKLLYSATFCLVWDERARQLVSPRTKHTPPDTDYWMELKEKLSAHILVNR